MINIIIPIASQNIHIEKKYLLPKNLISINGVPLIKLVINNFIDILSSNNNVIFVISEIEEFTYKTSHIIKKIIPNSKFFFTKGHTSGSVVSILLSCNLILVGLPLLIIGGDQVFQEDKKNLFLKLTSLKTNSLITVDDFSVESENSYSYARVHNNFVYYIEEKKSISNLKITGLYYFEDVSIFFNHIKEYILKFPNQEIYYISQVVNSMIENGIVFHNYLISSQGFIKYSNHKLLNEVNI